MSGKHDVVERRNLGKFFTIYDEKSYLKWIQSPYKNFFLVIITPNSSIVRCYKFSITRHLSKNFTAASKYMLDITFDLYLQI